MDRCENGGHIFQPPDQNPDLRCECGKLTLVIGTDRISIEGEAPPRSESN